VRTLQNPRSITRKRKHHPRLVPFRMLYVDVVDSTAYTIQDGTAAFIFTEDDASGLRLESFQATSGHLWQNQERDLWRLTLLDLDIQEDWATRILVPRPEELTSITVSSDSDILVAIWDAELDGETLTVTFTATAQDDFLKVSVDAVWQGTPTANWAIESVTVLPLRIPPKDDPFDAACCGAVKGIMVTAPMYRFRRVPADPTQPFGFFLGAASNFGHYPGGRTLAMPVWGYWSLLSRDGWMVCQEDHELQQIKAYFQSDGHRMWWEPFVAAPNSLTIGNDAAPITSGSLFIRPFVAGNLHGWWDVADFYRQRLAARPPPWRIEVPIRDETLAEDLRSFWINFHMGTLESTTEGQAIAVASDLRANAGIPATTPFVGLWTVPVRETRAYAPASGTLAGSASRWRRIVEILRDYHIYAGAWKGSMWLPTPWSEFVWDSLDGTSTRDVWNDKNLLDAVRTSRQGQIDGDTQAHRDESAAGDFWAEAVYTVDSYDTATHILTITGSFAEAGEWPAGQDFLGSEIVFWSAGYLARGRIVDSTTTPDPLKQVELDTWDFRDAAGNQVSPTPGDAVTFHKSTVTYCPHAMLGSSTFMAWLKEHLWGFSREHYGDSVQYFDVYPAFNRRNPRAFSCHSDHSGWSELDAGYVAHPQGGFFWDQAWRDFMHAIKNHLEEKHSNPVHQIYSEYLDETQQDLIGANLNTHGLSSLFRTTTLADDFDEHKITAVPLWPTVHAGRGVGLSWFQEFGNILLSQVARNDDFLPVAGDAHKFRLAISYAFAAEWPFGHQRLSYLQIVDATREPTTSLWDSSEFAPSHPWGAADTEVADIRDLWASLALAESRWALSFLRNGRLLRQLFPTVGSDVIDLTLTVFSEVTLPDLTTTPASTRTDTALIYSPTTFVQVVHGSWSHYATTLHTVVIFLTNPFDTPATLNLTVTFALLELLDERHQVFRVQPDGTLTDLGDHLTAYALGETLNPFTMHAIMLVPHSEREIREQEVKATLNPEITVAALQNAEVALRALQNPEVKVAVGAREQPVAAILAAEATVTIPTSEVL